MFVGDLIDRGTEQLETFQLIKAMVDAGSAQIMMGNHEFNAICWATQSAHRRHDRHRGMDRQLA